MERQPGAPASRKDWSCNLQPGEGGGVVKLTCICALLVLPCGCTGYEVRCTGPLRPINGTETAAQRARVAPLAVVTKAAATSQPDPPTGVLPSAPSRYWPTISAKRGPGMRTVHPT